MAIHLLLLTISWFRVLNILADEPSEDQFGEEVVWSAFASKPFVLVIADKDASDLAKTIGIALHKKYNGDYTAPEEHLRSSSANERVKIIPVAALPSVPGIFKWLFRRGFKKESPTGVILDWDSKLSKACGYTDGTVRIGIKLPKKKDILLFEPKTGNEAIRLIQVELDSSSQ